MAELVGAHKRRQQHPSSRLGRQQGTRQCAPLGEQIPGSPPPPLAFALRKTGGWVSRDPLQRSGTFSRGLVQLPIHHHGPSFIRFTACTCKFFGPLHLQEPWSLMLGRACVEVGACNVNSCAGGERDRGCQDKDLRKSGNAEGRGGGWYLLAPEPRSSTPGHQMERVACEITSNLRAATMK